MRSRLTKVAGALTLVAALAVGGATFASASSKAPAAPVKAKQAKAIKAKAKAKLNNSRARALAAPVKAKDAAPGVDGDNVQEGDQTTPDTPGAAESSSESAPESGSEVPGNDGPGGHADEVGTASAPGNAAADHQFQGEE